MTSFTEKIYYIDQDILKRIDSDFELIDHHDWYRLYQNITDKSFWRLDHWDKYQEQVFIRLETKEKWSEYNDKDLRIELLKKHRGTTANQCIWKDCDKNALKELTFCEYHAYIEIGIRK